MATTGPSLDTYARSVVEHAAEGVRLDIGWLDGLVDAERTRPPVTAEVVAQ